MERLLFIGIIMAFAALPVFAQDAAAVSGAKTVAGKVLRVPRDFKTIQAALDEADAGDTVFVDEGTYKESVVLRDDVVLTGVSAERTILVGDRKKPVVKGAQGAVVRNVAIENGQSGVLCANAIMTIENCVIRGNRGSGVHCLIALPVIRNNIIFRNAWSGIFCETTRSHKGYISNNVIAENVYSGINLAGQSEALVENNVFYFNKQYGAFTAEGARKSRIIYNVFYGNRQPGNAYSLIDHSNLNADPGYTAFSGSGYLFWEQSPDMLKNKGKDGKDIGAARKPPYKPSAPKPSPALKPAAAIKADNKAGDDAPVKAKAAVDTVKADKTVSAPANTDNAVADEAKQETPVGAAKTEEAVVDPVKAE